MHFGPVSLCIVDQNGSAWAIQDIRYVSNYVYCQTGFAGWINMSRFFGANVARIFVGQRVTLAVSNGTLYSCGAIFGTQMKMGKVLQPYSALDVSGFGETAYVLTADQLLQIDQ